MVFEKIAELLASHGNSAGQGTVCGFYHPVENLEACSLFIGLRLNFPLILSFHSKTLIN